MLAAPVAETRDVEHAVRARIGESRANLYDEITDKIIASICSHLPQAAVASLLRRGSPRIAIHP